MKHYNYILFSKTTFNNANPLSFGRHGTAAAIMTFQLLNQLLSKSGDDLGQYLAKQFEIVNSKLDRIDAKLSENIRLTIEGFRAMHHMLQGIARSQGRLMRETIESREVLLAHLQQMREDEARNFNIVKDNSRYSGGSKPKNARNCRVRGLRKFRPELPEHLCKTKSNFGNWASFSL